MCLCSTFDGLLVAMTKIFSLVASCILVKFQALGDFPAISSHLDFSSTPADEGTFSSICVKAVPC